MSNLKEQTRVQKTRKVAKNMLKIVKKEDLKNLPVKISSEQNKCKRLRKVDMLLNATKFVRDVVIEVNGSLIDKSQIKITKCYISGFKFDKNFEVQKYIVHLDGEITRTNKKTLFNPIDKLLAPALEAFSNQCKLFFN